MNPNTGGKKNCGMCCMEIPAGAKRCPYCRHFQSAKQFVIPGLLCAAVAGMFFLMVSMVESTFDMGEKFEPFSGQVKVVDSHLAHGETKAGPTVTVIGTMRNESAIPWKDVRFQVEFRDAAGRLIDAGQKEEYAFYAPPNSSLPIKISFRREFAETNYVGHAVRVMVAKDGPVRW